MTQESLALTLLTEEDVRRMDSLPRGPVAPGLRQVVAGDELSKHLENPILVAITQLLVRSRAARSKEAFLVRPQGTVGHNGRRVNQRLALCLNGGRHRGSDSSVHRLYIN